MNKFHFSIIVLLIVSFCAYLFLYGCSTNPTGDGAPTSSAPLYITVLNDTSALITWDAVVGADEYILSYGRDINATNIGIIHTSEVAYCLTGLTTSDTFYIKKKVVTAGVTGEYCSPVLFTTNYWNEVTSNMGGGRSDHSSVAFNNKIWIIGGNDGSGNLNDVWYSSNGASWSRATSAAGFSKRSSHASVVFDDYLWVIGGWDGSWKNDVWYSADGVNWYKATNNAGFSAWAIAGATVFIGKIWVVDSANDVWSSSDGFIWAKATSEAGFGNRYFSASFSYDNKLWLIAGHKVNTTDDFNDVWNSSDGLTWTQVTPEAVFSKRRSPGGVILDNKMWIIGGSDNKDLYSSSDGVTWNLIKNPWEFSGRSAFSAVAFNNKIYIMGGSGGGSVVYNDVWRSR